MIPILEDTISGFSSCSRTVAAKLSNLILSIWLKNTRFSKKVSGLSLTVRGIKTKAGNPSEGTSNMARAIFKGRWEGNSNLKIIIVCPSSLILCVVKIACLWP